MTPTACLYSSAKAVKIFLACRNSSGSFTLTPAFASYAPVKGGNDVVTSSLSSDEHERKRGDGGGDNRGGTGTVVGYVTACTQNQQPRFLKVELHTPLAFARKHLEKRRLLNLNPEEPRDNKVTAKLKFLCTTRETIVGSSSRIRSSMFPPM